MVNIKHIYPKKDDKIVHRKFTDIVLYERKYEILA